METERSLETTFMAVLHLLMEMHGRVQLTFKALVLKLLGAFGNHTMQVKMLH